MVFQKKLIGRVEDKMVIWAKRMIREQEREDAEKIKELYDELLKVQRIGQELYLIEELDDKKGYRISTVNSRTGEIIYEIKPKNNEGKK